MSDPYVGEVRLTAANYAPEGWFVCDGRTLAISNYEVLYTLLGTVYGGDGQVTFGLPDLRGRVAVHQGRGAAGSTYTVGEIGGVEGVALAIQNLPPHQHPCHGSSTPTSSSPASALLSDESAPEAPAVLVYTAPQAGVTTLSMRTLGPAGASTAHENRQPFLALNYMIAWAGIYPQPS